uniref:PROP1-like PPR domain-containing protein n=1 Tax=Chromera velia CCMP2878 TaxID=1169474 RepID=A0A0G4FYQ4_9ALVE|eukprot:Cvel_19306.t1-p1 / transcript=Cvel_19306.t1 / gene=Cvel_19306 / organism=Chromera_velia_CCMP2878 / gene_product=Pentatricopeptide repeat-containing protein, putative / transcript_product=Pentatricopeptide repeat-containing protein, putative / location=Cvel_scaffold1654:29990-35819(+) / protein_length=1868 / sequence_SO=supercontig / SO=protein_coding / is_pseudo=false
MPPLFSSVGAQEVDVKTPPAFLLTEEAEVPHRDERKDVDYRAMSLHSGETRGGARRRNDPSAVVGDLSAREGVSAESAEILHGRGQSAQAEEDSPDCHTSLSVPSLPVHFQQTPWGLVGKEEKRRAVRTVARLKERESSDLVLAQKCARILQKTAVDNGLWKEALALFMETERQGILPTLRSYFSVFFAMRIAAEAGIQWGKREVLRVFEEMKGRGLRPDVYVYSAVIALLSRLKGGDRWRVALGIFEEMKKGGVKPDLVTYNSLIAVLASEARASHWWRALDVYREMQQQGVEPNAATFRLLCNALEKVEGGARWQEAASVYEEMKAKVRLADRASQSAFMRVFRYAAGGSRWREAFAYQGEMEENGLKMTASVYSNLLAVLAHAPGESEWEKALQVFDEMRASGIQPTENTFSLLFQCLSRAGRFSQWEKTLELYGEMKGLGLIPTPAGYKGLIRAASRAPSRSEWEKVIELFEEMRQNGIEPTRWIFYELVSALDCSSPSSSSSLSPAAEFSNNKTKSNDSSRSGGGSSVSRAAALSRILKLAESLGYDIRREREREIVTVLDFEEERGGRDRWVAPPGSDGLSGGGGGADGGNEEEGATQPSGGGERLQKYRRIFSEGVGWYAWRQALVLLEEMEKDGLPVDPVCYSKALRILGNAGKWEAAVQLVDTMGHKGVKPTTSVYESLLDAFAAGAGVIGEGEREQGLWEVALEVFWKLEGVRREEGTRASLKAYEALILILAKGQQWELAWEVFEEMRRKAFDPSAGGVLEGKKKPFSPSVVNALLSGPGSQWRLALKLFEEAKENGWRPSGQSYALLLSTFRRAHQLEGGGRELRETAGKIGREGVEAFRSSLSFSETPGVKRGSADGTNPLLSSGQQSWWPLNRCASLLIALCQLSSVGVCPDLWKEAQMLLNLMRSVGMRPKVRHFNALLEALAKAPGGSRLEDALRLLEDMKARELPLDEFTYTALVDACRLAADRVHWETALVLREDMIRHGITPNAYVLVALLKTFRSAGLQLSHHTDLYLQLFREASEHPDVPPDAPAYLVLLVLLCKGDTGSAWLEALEVFEEFMQSQNRKRPSLRKMTYILRAILMVCERAYGGSLWKEALSVYRKMQTELRGLPHTRPDVISVNVLLGALSKAKGGSRWKEAWEEFEEAKASGLTPCYSTYTRMVQVCAHAAGGTRWEDVLRLLDEMKAEKETLDRNSRGEDKEGLLVVGFGKAMQTAIYKSRNGPGRQALLQALERWFPQSELVASIKARERRRGVGGVGGEAEEILGQHSSFSSSHPPGGIWGEGEELEFREDSQSPVLHALQELEECTEEKGQGGKGKEGLGYRDRGHGPSANFDLMKMKTERGSGRQKESARGLLVADEKRLLKLMSQGNEGERAGALTYLIDRAWDAKEAGEALENFVKESLKGDSLYRFSKSDAPIEPPSVHWYYRGGNPPEQVQGFTYLIQKTYTRRRQGSDWRGALSLYEDLKARGFQPEPLTYHYLFWSLAKASGGGQWECALKIFEEMRASGIQPTTSVYGSLLTCLARAPGGSKWKEAARLFDEMQVEGITPSTSSYNAMVEALGRVAGLEGGWKVSRALKLYEQMKLGGISPNAQTYIGLMNVLSSPIGALRWREALSIHQELKSQGVSVNEKMYTNLICVLAKVPGGSQWERALELFEEMKRGGLRPTVVTFTALFTCLANAKGGSKWEVALTLFREMKEGGIKPNKYTYCSLFTVFGRAKGGAQPGEVLKLFEEMMDKGIAVDSPTCAALLWTLAKAKGASQWQTVLLLFRESLKDGMLPSSSVYSAVRTALVNAQEWEKGTQLLRQAAACAVLKPELALKTFLQNVKGQKHWEDTGEILSKTSGVSERTTKP